MKERERILSLVKQGVLSTEEALILLENLAEGNEETITDATREEFSKAANEAQNKTAETQYSAEQLAEIEAKYGEAQQKVEKLTVEIADNEKKLNAQKEQLQVFDTMEELESSLTPEQAEEKAAIKSEIANLESALADLEKETNTAKEALQAAKQEKWQADKNQFSKKFEIPDDWKENTKETMNQVGDKVVEASNQIGKFIKSTVSQVMDSVDWHDVNIKVPGIAGEKFEHDFIYPNAKASIINVKVANGNVRFESWDEEDIKVNAKIKIYGKLDTANPFEAFLERSQIKVDDEVLNFDVPNKRVRADLTFYLPKRVYDHVSIKMLNGNLSFQDMETKDMFMSLTNGNFDLQKLKAIMIEIEGTNGNISLVDSETIDFLVNTVNGNITMKSAVTSSELSTVSGTIRVTLPEGDLKKVKASSMNGTIKIAVPTAIGLDGEVTTSLGNIQRRLSNVEVIQEKTDRLNQYLRFNREGNHENVLNIEAKTKTGNILLKDSDATQSEQPDEVEVDA